MPDFSSPRLGDDAPLAEVCHEQVQAAKLEIAAEDRPHAFGLGIIDGDPSVLGVVAERRHSTDPKPFALGGGDLVPDALRGDLSLELRKGQQDVEREPPHRRGRVELLGDGDERYAVSVEQLHEFGEVGQRTGQTVDLIDHDDVDLSGADIVQQPLQRRAIGVAAREAAIVVF